MSEQAQDRVIKELWVPQGAADPFLHPSIVLVHGFVPVFRLRWRFDLASGLERRGGWNNPAALTAWDMKKDGLKAAFVEVEHQRGWGITEALEIPGHMYAGMQWVAASSLSFSATPQGVFGATTGNAVVGLAMMTNDEKFTVLIDGRVLVRPLTDYEKQFKIREHSV